MVKQIPLTKGKFAIVDDEDFEWLLNYKWHENKGYACTNISIEKGKYKRMSMHRMITNAPIDKEVDHINCIRHDNRKENLRLVNRAQNTRNRGKLKNFENCTSKYKGVAFIRDKYHVYIRCNERIHIGVFVDEIAAANAYNYYAKKHHKEYAKLNDVPFLEKSEWEKFKVGKSSQYKGVSWKEGMRKWCVPIGSSELKYVYFEDEVVAANYYNHLCKKQINSCEYVSMDECERLIYVKPKTSKYNGVSWVKNSGKWGVRVIHNKKSYFIGYFESEIEAAKAYNEKIKELNIKFLERKFNVIE